MFVQMEILLNNYLLTRNFIPAIKHLFKKTYNKTRDVFVKLRNI